MPLDERSRLTFHAWLVDHDLDAEVASAILGVMPPFDWHEIPKKHDLYLRFEDVDRRFEQVDRRFEQVDRRFQQVDRRFEQVDRRFEEIDRRFDHVDARFDHVDARFDHVDARFDVLGRSIEGQLDKAMAENLRWTLVTMVVLLTAFAGLILRFG
jgi:hypothetical protein